MDPEHAPTSIRRVIWDGSIPCQVLLNPGECRSFDVSDPFYIQLPRISYLPLFLPQMHAFFESYLIDPVNAAPSTAWLDFEGVPLKWHWPVGLLYDLLTGRDPSSAPTTATNSDDEHRLPWTLTLHFDAFPYEHLMRLDTLSACQDAFINSIKEADYMRNGNSRAVMSLSMTDSAKLWESIETHDFDMYWSVGEKLLSSDTYPIRHIPLKVYLPSASKVTQKLIPPQLSPREACTLGMALKMLIPELFVSKTTAIIARPVIHGIVIPMNTPLLDLMRDAVYPDGFLHVVVAMMY